MSDFMTEGEESKSHYFDVLNDEIDLECVICTDKMTKKERYRKEKVG